MPSGARTAWNLTRRNRRLLAGIAGIPNLAVEAIAHHHHPTRIPHSGIDPTVAVYVVDLLDHELDAHPQDAAGLQIEEHDRACLEKLGLLPRFAEFRAWRPKVETKRRASANFRTD
jgi:hypothetical protein